jgi:hypothetical protein
VSLRYFMMNRPALDDIDDGLQGTQCHIRWQVPKVMLGPRIPHRVE